MMSLLTKSSPFDVEVEKATNPNNITEDWSQIMDICDAVGNNKQKAKDCLKAIVKRLNAQDPHIVIQAITLLDACSSNCGKTFHLEIASRDFETELRKLLTQNSQREQFQIVDKLKSLIKKWAEGDFKSDPELNLIPTLYTRMQSEGVIFSSNTEATKKHSSAAAAAAASKEEQELLAKAIELSLKESKQHSSNSSHGSPSSAKMTSLYPNVNIPFTATTAPERRKVRALYDFEAAEENELSFAAGDIIHILDDSDTNWWKGAKGRMEGLFPSNFVTADLSVEPDQMTKLEQGTKKSVQFAEEVEVKTLKREPEVIEVEIDEGKIDRLLHLLHEADPQCDTSDPPEMLDLEEQVTAMGPLIDAALEKVDRRHAQLTQLSSDLVDALNLYHTLMREPAATSNYNTLPKMPPHMNVYPYPNQPQHMYNGMPQHPQANYNPAGGLPPGAAYNPNMTTMPPTALPPNDYMHHHNMPGHNMTMPQQYHHMPPGHHHPPGPPQQQQQQQQAAHPSGPPSGPPQVHPSQGIPPPGHHPGMPPPQSHPTGHPQALPQGPINSQSEQTNVPYQNQGFPPQVMQLPAQYITPGPPGTISLNQPQYTPANGQHMM